MSGPDIVPSNPSALPLAPNAATETTLGTVAKEYPLTPTSGGSADGISVGAADAALFNAFPAGTYRVGVTGYAPGVGSGGRVWIRLGAAAAKPAAHALSAAGTHGLTPGVERTVVLADAGDHALHGHADGGTCTLHLDRVA